jgi:phosphoesterase RecJ-like protein
VKQLTLKELCDRIAGIDRPLIVMHTRPDGDTVGSAAAMMRLFELLGKTPRCLAPDPIPRRLSFLTEGLDFTPPALDGQPYTVLTVDVASKGQLGRLGEQLVGDLFPVLMIDHHERGEAYADSYVRPSAAAVGEIVFDLVKYMYEAKMIPELPVNLLSPIYAAITSDTGCFKYSNTTPHTHRTAAELISLGVDASEINRLLFDVKSAEQLRAEGYVQSNLRRHESGRIAWVAISRACRESLGLLDEHFETAIDVVRSLEGVEIAVAVKESPDGRFKASLRSTGADVASIAASLGGGGHVRAAGCSLVAESVEAAADAVIEKVWETIKTPEDT